MKKEIILSGELKVNQWEEEITIDREEITASLLDAIETKYPKLYKELVKDNLDTDDEFDEYNITIPECEVSLYWSNNEEDFETMKIYYLTQMFGCLELDGNQYGYSAWTIMGFEVTRFQLGDHDLKEILNDISGKYIHMIFKFN